jgi:hypothetical protein
MMDHKASASVSISVFSIVRMAAESARDALEIVSAVYESAVEGHPSSSAKSKIHHLERTLPSAPTVSILHQPRRTSAAVGSIGT